MATMNPDAILLAAEKKIAEKLLPICLGVHIAPAVMQGLFPDDLTLPIFVDDVEFSEEEEEQSVLKVPDDKFKVYMLKVLDEASFTTSCFTDEKFPSFVIELVKRGGDPISDSQALLNLTRVRLTVWNRWAEVTHEVLQPIPGETYPMFQLQEGKVVISGLVFREITHKHGGYFKIHVQVSSPVVSEMTLEWLSPRISVHSHKVRIKQNRKKQRKDFLNDDSSTE